MDLGALGELVSQYFAGGVARRTQSSYSSAQRRYLTFCETYCLSPLPLSECAVCLFAAYLAHQGLQPTSISAYLAALRHLQVSAGLPPPPRSEWPRLQYVLRGITRAQITNRRNRLPITSQIMQQLQSVFSRWTDREVDARMLWAACCVGYFGFMRSGEFTLPDSRSPPAILSSDVAIDSHAAPTLCRLFLRRSKTDQEGRGVWIYFGKTDSVICPVSALANYLAVRPPPPGPLFMFHNGTPLTRDRFVQEVRGALRVAGVNESAYSGHSFRIGAATAAARAGVPAFIIKLLGRWESEAFQLYVQTPRETLATISRMIV